MFLGVGGGDGGLRGILDEGGGDGGRPDPPETDGPTEYEG